MGLENQATASQLDDLLLEAEAAMSAGAEGDTEQDFEDVCDLITSGDGGRNKSVDELHLQFGVYERATIERALRYVNKA